MYCADPGSKVAGVAPAFVFAFAPAAFVFADGAGVFGAGTGSEQATVEASAHPSAIPTIVLFMWVESSSARGAPPRSTAEMLEQIGEAEPHGDGRQKDPERRRDLDGAPDGPPRDPRVARLGREDDLREPARGRVPEHERDDERDDDVDGEHRSLGDHCGLRPARWTNQQR